MGCGFSYMHVYISIYIYFFSCLIVFSFLIKRNTVLSPGFSMPFHNSTFI